MNDAPAAQQRIAARHIAAVVLGNALEFYDFLTFSFFAVYIGRAFFPSTDPTISLLATLATFGAGFLTRPIGAFVIGRIGDRRGRKPAMLLSFWLMGIAIVGLALTPPQSRIGVAAPLLVVFFRLVQGFALGGEVGPTTAFLLELAPLQRRGFYTALQFWSQDLATLTAGLVGFALANLLTARQLQDFGWRIAFLAGAAVIPAGLAIRRGLPETFHAVRDAALSATSPAASDNTHLPTPLRPYLAVAGLGLMMILGGTVGVYTRNYATTYAISTLHMKANIAFAATIVVGLSGVLVGLFAGALSDRIGRKPVLLTSGFLLLVSILPAFYAILHYRSAVVFLGANALLAVTAGFYSPVIIVWLTESLPVHIRSSGLALVYASSVSVFGGSTQFLITWLIRRTGNPMAPAFYWTAAMAIGVTAVCLAHESAPRIIGRSNSDSDSNDEPVAELAAR